MSFATSRPPHETRPGGACALGLLGMVAALLCFLAERVLPRMGREADAATVGAFLNLAHAMQLLAAVAWREIETEPHEGGATSALHDAAERMHGALLALVGVLAQGGGRRRRVPNAARRVAAREGRALSPRPVRGRPTHRQRARDGPHLAASA